MEFVPSRLVRKRLDHLREENTDVLPSPQTSTSTSVASSRSVANPATPHMCGLLNMSKSFHGTQHPCADASTSRVTQVTIESKLRKAMTQRMSHGVAALSERACRTPMLRPLQSSHRIASHSSCARLQQTQVDDITQDSTEHIAQRAPTATEFTRKGLNLKC